MSREMKRVSPRNDAAQKFYLPIQHHVHVSRVYPVCNSDRLVPIIYGHGSGITVVWVDDATDSVISNPSHTSSPGPFLPSTFDFSLGSTVLDISIPHIPPEAGLYRSIAVPQLFRQNIIVAVACSDFAVRVLKLPLETTHSLEHANPTSGEILATISQNSVPTSVAITWITGGSKSKSPHDDEDMDVDHGGQNGDDVDSAGIHLIVASCSRDSIGSIQFTSVPILQHQTTRAIPFQTLKLSEVPIKIEFHPSAHTSNHHSRILIACSAGLVYIYDPFSYSKRHESAGEATLPAKGMWVAVYSTKFSPASEEDQFSSASAQRRRILDASWASNGRSIIVLLTDGEWGVWSVRNSQSGKSISYTSSFVLWGMVGSGIPSHLAQGSKKSLDSRNSLPTMTPNTRRVKENNLFVGLANSPNAAPRGGLSVNPVLLPSADNTEDSVVLWYNDTVCYVDSLQSYLSRAAKRSTEAKMHTAGGSLFGPGLTRVEDLNLNGQLITSVGQVISNDATSPHNRGVILLSCEHQLVIASHRSWRPADQVRISASATRPVSDLRRSQALLDRGELDIDQLDILMDEMDGAAAAGAAGIPGSRGLSGSRQLIGDSDGPYMSGALPLLEGP